MATSKTNDGQLIWLWKGLTNTSNGSRFFIVLCSAVLVVTSLKLSFVWLDLKSGLLNESVKSNQNYINDASEDNAKFDDVLQHIDGETKSLLRCFSDYKNMKSKQQFGLMDDDYARSRAYHGNTRRLSIFLDKLQARQQPVTVVSHGGSISLGHGIEPMDDMYSNTFVNWLNAYYPVILEPFSSGENTAHTLINHARHGADVSTFRE
jgi:hypothetical protein